MPRICADEFLEAVKPALNRGDVRSLCDAVCGRWSPTELCGLLGHREVDVRRTAVVVLGMVGGCEVVGCVTRCLHDADEQVHQFAEDALWSLWLRAGKPEAAEAFAQGMTALAEDQYPQAIAEFEAALKLDRAFAEAYNQLAIAHYMNEQWVASVVACRQALSLMPTHFGAMAGLGHGYAHCGQHRQAIDCYRRALAINPRMATVAAAKTRLESQPPPVEGQGAPPCGLTETVLLRFDSDFIASSDPGNPSGLRDVPGWPSSG